MSVYLNILLLYHIGSLWWYYSASLLTVKPQHFLILLISCEIPAEFQQYRIISAQKSDLKPEELTHTFHHNRL